MQRQAQGYPPWSRFCLSKTPFIVWQVSPCPPQTRHLSSTTVEPIWRSQPTFCLKSVNILIINDPVSSRWPVDGENGFKWRFLTSIILGLFYSLCVCARMRARMYLKELRIQMMASLKYYLLWSIPIFKKIYISMHESVDSQGKLLHHDYSPKRLLCPFSHANAGSSRQTCRVWLYEPKLYTTIT